jgi:hypothetical protein
MNSNGSELGTVVRHLPVPCKMENPRNSFAAISYQAAFCHTSWQLSANTAMQFFVWSVGYLQMAHSKGLMGATSYSHVMTVLEDRQNGETSL